MASTLKDQLHDWRRDRGMRVNSLYLDLPYFVGNLDPGSWFVPVSCVTRGGPFIMMESTIRLSVDKGYKHVNCISVSTGKMFYFGPKTKIKIVKGRQKDKLNEY